MTQDFRVSGVTTWAQSSIGIRGCLLNIEPHPAKHASNTTDAGEGSRTWRQWQQDIRVLDIRAKGLHYELKPGEQKTTVCRNGNLTGGPNINHFSENCILVQ